MQIGILDLLVIYAIPFVLLGGGLATFFLSLFVIVKKDIGKLAFSEDLRHNIELRKRRVSLGTVAQLMLFDSGIQAAFLYRCARFLHLRGMRGPASMLHKVCKYVTNVDLPPTTKVGPGVTFLHCCNIVIGPYIEIGSHVMFRPFVAVRGWGTVKIEDNVRTGLQSCIMDCVTLGEGSEVAPGAIVTQDVPPHHVAFGIPAKRMVPKPQSKLQGVVLELESVLLEPSPLLSDALRASLTSLGVSLPRPGKVALEDLPPGRILRDQVGGDGERQEEALRTYSQAVLAGIGSGLRLRNHAKELVEKIRERGLKVAVVSRLPDGLAQEVAEQLGLMPSLDCVSGADAYLDEWKPEPWVLFQPMRELRLGVERVIYVAGTPLDVRAGAEAAVRVYWVNPDEALKAPRGLVDRHVDLASVLVAFSGADLPQAL